VAKEYTASTDATVLSTAGDATLTVADPSTNEVVPVTFKQAIGAADPLRTGTYSKTLTFTLSTTAP
jgi:hypothetical protein